MERVGEAHKSRHFTKCSPIDIILEMDDNTSDPQIVNRLNQFPPYTDAVGNIIDKPAPQIETPVETEGPAVEKVEEPEEIVEEVEIPEPVEEPTEDEALANSKNPERTKKFIEKLKKQNEELKTPRKPILEALEPEVPQWPLPPTTNVAPQEFPGLTKSEIDSTFKNLVDEQGYVDSGLLINSLNEAKTKNDNLQRELDKTRNETQKTNQRLDDFERNETMKGIHSRYPKLDPTNIAEDLPEDKKFDDRLWNYVQKNMVSEWVNEASSGKVVNPNDKKAQAERLERITQKGMEYLPYLDEKGEVDVKLIEMKKAEKQQADQVDSAKRNINATGGSISGQRNTYGDHEALVEATRHGVPGSLAERLRRAGQ